jgi:hypothetical protein
MSPTKDYISSLSKDVGHQIAGLITPLSRASLGRAFAGVNLTFYFTSAQRKSARVWDMMFKDETWFQAVKKIQYNFASPPNPTPVGCDLPRLYNGYSTSAYIALVVCDMGGEYQFLRTIPDLSNKSAV